MTTPAVNTAKTRHPEHSAPLLALTPLLVTTCHKQHTAGLQYLAASLWQGMDG